MTGPGEGKLPLKAKVYLNSQIIKANVYIHKKGYSLARVTHLDIESESFGIRSGGEFLSINGIENGLEIKGKEWKVVVEAKELNKVLGVGEKTRTWVGGKEYGIYIGFKKREIEKLEEIANAL